MNYQKCYDRIIERARNRTPTEYTEIHHVIPKCLGGSNAKENLVKLTPEEHFVCHQLLVKIHPGNKGLICAVIFLTAMKDGIPRNNKSYGWLRRKIVEAMTDVKFTKERCENISKACKGRIPWNKKSWEELSYATKCKLYSKKDSRVPVDWKPEVVRGTPASSKRISDAHKGRVIPLEERAKHGHKWTDAEKQAQAEKIKIVRAQKKWSTKRKGILL